MDIHPECIPCFFRQALQTARLAAPGDEAAQRRILQRLSVHIAGLPATTAPPVVGGLIHTVSEEVTGRSDFYKAAKKDGLAQVLPLLPLLERHVQKAADPLREAVLAAIAGNVIDWGANPNFDIDAELAALSAGEHTLEQFEHFRREVESADRILYILDNLEEAVFDMVLIQTLVSMGRRVVAAVRAKPVFNDITLEDARRIGLDRLCPIISSGSAIPGTDLDSATPTFYDLFHSGAMVISKGQGNYESLMDAPRPIWFLFKVKCPVVARLAGFPEGASVLCRRSDGIAQ